MYQLKLITIIIALSIPFSMTAQGWEMTYGGELTEYTRAADLTLDGGTVICGTQSDDDLDISYSFIYKTDNQGNLLWEFYDSLHSGSFVNTLDVMATSDGHYLLSSIYGNNPPANNYLVQKIAEDNSVIWENDFSDIPTLDYVTDMYEAADGSIFMLGSGPATSGITSVTALKLSADGEVDWTYHYSPFDAPAFTGAITETANGDVLFTGYFGYSNDSQDIYAKRLDSNTGTVIWEADYTNNSDNLFATGILEMANGEIVIGGFSNFDFSLNTPILIKLDASGNQLWYKPFPDFNQASGTVSLQKTTDGGLAFAGSINSNLGVNDYYLLKMDADGNPLWSNQYGRSGADFLFELLEAPDQGFYLAGFTQLSNSNDDVYLVKTDSLGNSLTNLISGNVFQDQNENCLPESGEEGLNQVLLEVTKGDIRYLTLSDESGNYSFTVDSGSYEISAYPISPFWGFCDDLYTVDLPNLNDTIVQDFAAQVIIECPYLDVSIGTPFLRRCFESTYTVQYCNYGTLIAPDAYADVVLDPDMIFVGTNHPNFTQIGDTLRFELGDIAIGACDDLKFDVLLGDSITCDSIELGATHCVEAHIYPDSICLPANNWSGASIEVDAICDGDSLLFIIKNVGSAPTQSNLQYFVIEDDVILFSGDFELEPEQVETIPVLTSGATFRIEVEQEPNHPGIDAPSVSVEGCGTNNTTVSFGFINVFPQNDGDPFIDIDCRNNIGAYDPNDKTGFPIGYGESHYISRGQDIEYLIRFQNTGTDTAFNVVIQDTLSELLDITSIRPGASSHPYDFDITGNGVLVFNFNNIMLPDSNVNEPASNGFVKFKIAQQPDLELESKIYNTAAIYFDFNQPVITNETVHTIGENYVLVSIDPEVNSLAAVKVYPNPFSHQATIEVEGIDINSGIFRLYDARGRLLRNASFNTNSFTLDKKDLQSGMYFFTIENAGQLVTSGKLIAQ